MKATAQPLVRLNTGETFDRCPKAYLVQDCGELNDYFRAFRNFERRGVLPSAGGYDDQDPTFIEALELITTTTLTVVKTKRAIDKAKAEAKARLHQVKGLKVV
jgi:hypothetical protein